MEDRREDVRREPVSAELEILVHILRKIENPTVLPRDYKKSAGEVKNNSVNEVHLI